MHGVSMRENREIRRSLRRLVMVAGGVVRRRLRP
jgi:hypothetical protein